MLNVWKMTVVVSKSSVYDTNQI